MEQGFLKPIKNPITYSVDCDAIQVLLTSQKQLRSDDHGRRIDAFVEFVGAQNLKFRAPVKAGETVTARVTVKDVNRDNKRVVVDTVCTVADTVVIDGEALLMVSRRAEVLAESEAPVEAAAAPGIDAAE